MWRLRSYDDSTRLSLHRHLHIGLWRSLLLIALLSLSNVLTQVDSEIMAFSERAPASTSGESEPSIDPIQVCQNYTILNSQQLNICQRYPHATASAMQGVELSVHECRRQFSGYRWNCSNLNQNITGTHEILQRGYKETAYTQAIAAAGILHQIAKSCALGMVRGCGCDRDHAMTDFEWQGCSHDLGFGAKFSRRFLQYQDENSMQSMMQAHNSKIGRKAVIDKKSTKCKCHGMSSSCEIKTCWLSTPDFHAVGSKLKSLYSDSVLIERESTDEEESSPSPAANSPIVTVQYQKGGNLNKKMVHYERSPTYCDAVPELGIPGTSGRVCNSTSTNIDSCSALCCGRGYFIKKVRRVEKCNCTFHWCCYVVCDTCEYDEWVTVCK